MRVSERAAAVEESATLRLAAELSRLRAAGVDVVSLLEGEADLPVPEPVAQATMRAIRDGRTRYSSSAGLFELKSAIARKLKERNGIDAGPENVLVANGAKQAVYDVLQALCGPGDEVIVPRPYWVSFPESVKLAGAKPVFVETPGFALDPRKIAAAVTRRTRALILNSPNNPTGAVYPEAALREVVKLAAKRDLRVISDEAYEDLVYDGGKHRSIASLGPEAAKRTVTIQTFSKSFSMTGFRVGYLAADEELVKAVGRVHGHVTGNVCTFVQHGAMAALGLKADFLEKRRAAFQKRRDLAFRLASRLFPCEKPQGAFYLFPDVRRYLGGRFKDSGELAAHLLTEGKVAVVSGSACGVEGRLRISFSTSEENIREGFRRMEEALSL